MSNLFGSALPVICREDTSSLRLRSAVCASYALRSLRSTFKQRAEGCSVSVLLGLSILHLVSFAEVAKRFSDGSSSSFPNAISSPVGLLALPIFAYLLVYAVGLFLIFSSLKNFRNSIS